MTRSWYVPLGGDGTDAGISRLPLVRKASNSPADPAPQEGPPGGPLWSAGLHYGRITKSLRKSRAEAVSSL